MGTGASDALFALDGLVERLFVHKSGGGGDGCATNAPGPLIRDTVCWATTPAGGAAFELGVNATSATTTLRNVTAASVGADGIRLSTFGPANATLDANNVISAGEDTGTPADVRPLSGVEALAR